MLVDAEIIVRVILRGEVMAMGVRLLLQRLFEPPDPLCKWSQRLIDHVTDFFLAHVVASSGVASANILTGQSCRL